MTHKSNKMEKELDYSRPFAAEEVEKLKEIFRQMSTYTEDEHDSYVLSSDVTAILKAINYYRDDEQAQAYKAFWDEHYGGRIPLSKYLEVLTGVHNTATTAKFAATAWDKNGDGFICKDEFKAFVDLMEAHVPKLKGIIYKEFVTQADIDGDGKVSIDEFSAWVYKKIGH